MSESEKVAPERDENAPGTPIQRPGGEVTELDALIAYLQMLGTLVDVNAAAAQEDLAKEKGR